MKRIRAIWAKLKISFKSEDQLIIDQIKNLDKTDSSNFSKLADLYHRLANSYAMVSSHFYACGKSIECNQYHMLARMMYEDYQYYKLLFYNKDVLLA